MGSGITNTDGQVDPIVHQRLMGLAGGYRVSQALYVAATLGIADELKDGPRGVDDLARATNSDAAALYRLLRFLAAHGVLREEGGNFSSTTLSEPLRSDVPGSVGATVRMLLERSNWEAWGDLLHSVRTGQTAFEHVHGMGRFEYMTAHPDTAAAFNAAMTSNAAQSGTSILNYDFSGIETVVDVGGGHGLLLATILRAHHRLRGVLFDQPEVVAGAAPLLERAGVATRCEVVGGNFFDSVPARADAYVLRQIIHDWDDVRATKILMACARAMSAAGRVLVVERRIAADYREATLVLHLDLEMLVSVGGRERTDDEYATLFSSAGLRLANIVPLGDAVQFHVFEGVPA